MAIKQCAIAAPNKEAFDLACETAMQCIEMGGCGFTGLAPGLFSEIEKIDDCRVLWALL